MENIYISTSQNISLEQSVASIGERILAQIIDYFFIGIYWIFVMIIYQITLNTLANNSIAIIIVLMIPILLYDLLCEVFFNGQNIGKRIMKLKVVSVNGSQPEFMSYFIRWMFRIIDITMSFGSVATLTIIFNGQGRRLGDIAAGTRVIRLKPIEHKIILETLELPDNYQPVFAESENLTDQDYAIILELFEFRSQQGFSPTVVDYLKSAKEKLCKKLNITSNLSANHFLEALQKDYIYFNRQKN
jgi:uncharacterized RDD family membrane protein YckC